MNVRFSERSLHRRFYDATYDPGMVWDGRHYVHREPNNLCPYFWKIVLAVFLLPLTWPAYLKELVFGRESFGMKIGFGLAVHVCIAVVLVGTIATFPEHPLWIGLLYMTGYILAVVLVLGLALVVFAGIVAAIKVGLEELSRRRARAKMEAPTDENSPLIRSKVRAYKEKVCPRIDWKL